MTDETRATSVGPNPSKSKAAQNMERARAAKAAKKAAELVSDSRDELIEQLTKQVSNLQTAVLQMGAERSQKQEATLAPIPGPSPELPPGTYFQVGIDAAGAPIMGKVPWTREVLEKTYIPVTFTPMRTMDFGPHGVHYHVDAGVEATVPKIVKDFYDEALKGEAADRAKYRPIGATEAYELAARAAEAPGKHWSRLYRAGTGLDVRGPEPEGTPETPVQ